MGKKSFFKKKSRKVIISLLLVFAMVIPMIVSATPDKDDKVQIIGESGTKIGGTGELLDGNMVAPVYGESLGFSTFANPVSMVGFDGKNLATSPTFNYPSFEKAVGTSKVLSINANFGDDVTAVAKRQVVVKAKPGMEFKLIPGMKKNNGNWVADNSTLGNLEGYVSKVTFQKDPTTYPGGYKGQGGTVIYDFYPGLANTVINMQLACDEAFAWGTNFLIKDAVEVEVRGSQKATPDTMEVFTKAEVKNISGNGGYFNMFSNYRNHLGGRLLLQPGETGTLRVDNDRLKGAHYLIDELVITYTVPKTLNFKSVKYISGGDTSKPLSIKTEPFDGTHNKVIVTLKNTKAYFKLEYEIEAASDAPIGRIPDIQATISAKTINQKPGTVTSVYSEPLEIQIVGPYKSQLNLMNHNMGLNLDPTNTEPVHLASFRGQNLQQKALENQRIKLDLSDPSIQVTAVRLWGPKLSPEGKEIGTDVRNIKITTKEGKTLTIPSITDTSEGARGTMVKLNTVIPSVSPTDGIKTIEYTIPKINSLMEFVYHVAHSGHRLSCYGYTTKTSGNFTTNIYSTSADDADFSGSNVTTAKTTTTIETNKRVHIASGFSIGKNNLSAGETGHSQFAITHTSNAGTNVQKIKGWEFYIRDMPDCTIKKDTIKITQYGSNPKIFTVSSITEETDNQGKKYLKIVSNDAYTEQFGPNNTQQAGIRIDFDFTVNKDASPRSISMLDYLFASPKDKSMAFTSYENAHVKDVYNLTKAGVNTNIIGLPHRAVVTTYNIDALTDFKVYTSANLNNGPWEIYDPVANTGVITLNPEGQAKYRLAINNNSDGDVTGFIGFIPIPKYNQVVNPALMPSNPSGYSPAQHIQKAPFEWDISINAEPTVTGDVPLQFLYSTDYVTSINGGTWKSWGSISDKTQIKMIKVTSAAPGGAVPKGKSAELTFPITLDAQADSRSGAINTYSAYLYRSINGNVGYAPSEPVSILLKTGTIKGVVFNDTNKNGIKDPGEAGVTGVKVQLYNQGKVGVEAPVEEKVTGNNGEYAFVTLDKGQKMDIVFVNPVTDDSKRFSTPPDEANHKTAVVLNATEGTKTLHAGLMTPYKVEVKGDGVTQKNITKYRNEKIAETEMPAKSLTGYTFKEWQNSANTEVVFPYTVTKDETLKPIWEPNKYKVTFDLNGGAGTAPNAIEKEYNTKVGTLPTATKPLYTFKGWTKTKDGTDYIDENYVVKDNITVYAKWDKDTGTKITVSYDLNGGKLGTATAKSPTQHDAHSKVPNPGTPTIGGLDFDKWHRIEGGVDKGEYNFNAAFTPATFKNFTLKATWKANANKKVNVIFDPNDAGGTPAVGIPAPKTYVHGEKITKPDVTRVGYNKPVWLLNNTEWKFTSDTIKSEHFGSTNTTNLTLVAQWTKNPAYVVTVKFNLDGGTAVNSGAVANQPHGIDEKITLPAATDVKKNGYTFVEWQYNNTKWNANDLIKPVHGRNIELKAKWKIDTTTAGEKQATFDPAGGTQIGTITVNMAPQTLHVEDKVKQPNPEPKQAGKTFLGWYRKIGTAVDTNLWNFGTQLSHTDWNNIELVAKWETNSADKKVVKYHLQDDDNNMLTPKTYNVDSKLPKPTDPTRPGYTFGGWYKEPACNNAWNFNTVIGSANFRDYDLYAKWSVDATKTVPVTFDIQPGKQAPTATVKANVTQNLKATDLVQKPDLVTYNGHKIDSWFIAGTSTNWNYGTDTIKSKHFPNGFKLVTKWVIDTNQKHTISFNLDGGKLSGVTGNPPNQVLHIGQLITNPGTPTKTGEKFVGWYIDGTNTKWDFTKKMTPEQFKDFTLKARYQVDKTQGATLKFDVNKGTPAVASVKIPLHSKATAPVGVTRAGYKLDGWRVVGESSNWNFGTRTIVASEIGKTLTLKAQWSPDPSKPIKATFDPENGDLVTTQTVLVDSPFANVPLPTRAGYKTDGWYYDTDARAIKKWNFATVLDEKTYKANYKFNPNWSVDRSQSITVTFDLKGGTGNVPPQKLHAEDKVKMPNPLPVRPGYKVLGWTVAGTNTEWNFNTKITHTNFNDMTLEAKWGIDKTQTKEVRYDLRGGEGNIPAQRVAISDLIVEPSAIPTKLGYTFTGWVDKNNNPWDFSNPIVDATYKDTVIYASWRVDPNVKFDVKFDTQGGAPVPATQKLPAESTVTLPTEKPKKFGWIFNGWYTEPKGGKKWDFATDKIVASKTGTTIYAQWIGDPDMSFDVRFNTYGGMPMPATQSGPAGTLVKRPETDPTRSRWSFSGWYEDEACTKEWDFNTGIIEAIPEGTVIHAKWTRDHDGGTTKPDGNGLNGGGNGNNGAGNGSGNGSNNGGQNNNGPGNSGNGHGWIGPNGQLQDGMKDGSWYDGSKITPSSVGGKLSDLTKEERAFWEAVLQLEKDLDETTESWSIDYRDYKNPVEMDSKQNKVQSLVGPYANMPAFVTEELRSENNRNLEINLGNYRWFFSADSNWSDPVFETYPVAVYDSNFKTLRNMIGGDVPSHQFKLEYSGNWNTTPQLMVKISDNELLDEQLYLYHYNENTNQLEYIAPMEALNDDWYGVTMPANVTSNSGEYIITSYVYKNATAVSTSENPSTGGDTMGDLVANGVIVPEADKMVETYTVVNSSIHWQWALLGLIPVAAVVAIVLNKKKKNSEI